MVIPVLVVPTNDGALISRYNILDVKKSSQFTDNI
jgi:hypothetical protein